MAFPDSALANQWPTLGEEETQVTMAARIDANFNLLVPRVSDSGLIAPTMINSWVNFGSGNEVAGYRKVGLAVWCSGLIKNGTTGTIFTLPVGMRPLNQLSFSTLAFSGNAVIAVSSAGVVSVTGYTGAGTNAEVSLNGIQFVAEQ